MTHKGRTGASRTIRRLASLQSKLAAILVGMIALILVTNLFIFGRTNRMLSQIDSVFASNVTIGELKESLSRVGDSVYEYLNTKSSKSLENYYRYSQQYSDLVQQLSAVNSDNELHILEKNIREMSLTYLTLADETVQAKRGRNVEQYKASYESMSGLEEYIGYYIYELNNSQFALNSENYEFLIGVMSVMESFSMAIMLSVAVIAMSLAISLVRQMFVPLNDLEKAAHQVAAGNFAVELPIATSDDEIGVVNRAFRHMLSSIREYIVQLRSSMEKEARMKQRELTMEAHLKEAQLKFLQAQINPHFLFNSLNAGAQLAMMEDAEATGEFLEKMADFFRYNVKKTNEDTTLAEEIALVDNYIYILNVRFAGDITYMKHIDEDLDIPLDSIQVPSMILQPLVENAVTHGIRSMLDQGAISLSLERGDDELLITVTDNGVGMSHEEIRRVMEGSVIHEEDQSDSTGIGLENVRHRMELYYDETDLMSIYSEGRNRGVEVSLRIPLKDQWHKDKEETVAAKRTDDRQTTDNMQHVR